MTRIELEQHLAKMVSTLDRDAVQDVVDHTTYLAGPSFYATASAAAKASIDRGIADADAGDVSPADAVAERMAQHLKARGL